MICGEVSINMSVLCYHGSNQGNGDIEEKMNTSMWNLWKDQDGFLMFHIYSCLYHRSTGGVEQENKVCGFPSPQTISDWLGLILFRSLCSCTVCWLFSDTEEEGGGKSLALESSSVLYCC